MKVMPVLHWGRRRPKRPLYLPDRLGVSLYFRRKVTHRHRMVSVIWERCGFAMKLALSGSVGACAGKIELGDSRLEWRNGKGLALKAVLQP